MKINSKYLNEMIKNSILKTLNENYFDEGIVTYFDSNDDNSSDDSSNNVVANGPDPRFKEIEEFYNTELFTSGGRSNNETRRKKIRNTLSAFAKTNGGYAFNDSTITPWDIVSDTLKFTPDEFADKKGIEEFFSYFYKRLGDQINLFKRQIQKAKSPSSTNNDSGIVKRKTKDIYVPTKQVEYDIEGKYCVYKIQDGKPVMNFNFPNISVFKVYITPNGMKHLEKAYNDMETIWEEIDEYTLYDYTNHDNGYQRQQTGEMGKNILNIKKYATKGKHPLTGEDVVTVDEFGNTIYIDKDTGEVIPYGNRDEIAQYWEEPIRNAREKYGDGRRKSINEARPEPFYPDENGNLTLREPINGIDMFDTYNDTEEFFATYPVRDEEGNLMYFYVISNENLKPKEMLQHLHAIVTKTYQRPKMNLDNASNDYSIRWTPVYRENEKGTLCFVKHINSAKLTPLDVIPEEDVKESFIEDWTKYYGYIAMQHNEEVEATNGVSARNQRAGSMGGVSHYGIAQTNESKLTQMIFESIKRHLK